MAQDTLPTQQRGARRRRTLWILGGLVLVLGGIATAFALTGGTEQAGPTVLAPPVETPPTLAAADVAAVFLGDSYTQGWGASQPSLRWSALVADEAGWVEVNQGQGGTGFVTVAGPGCGQEFCPTYLDRVPDVIAVHPDVVVIAGGQNDLVALGGDPAIVHAAVDETYDLIRQGLPEARIIAVGPSLAQPGNALISDLDEWVQAAAARVDAEYVSLIDPAVIAPTMVTADGVHVNDEGHRAIADRVLAGIR